MNSNITCCISQCKYNDEQTKTCKAQHISVSSCVQNVACTSSETMCSTFSPKN